MTETPVPPLRTVQTRNAGREVELKLHVSPDDLARLISAPDLPGQDERAPQSQHLHTVYYDTPDLQLLAAGVSLRVRHRGDRFVQAVKTLNREAQGDDAAIARRRGWEWLLSDGQLDLSRLKQPAVAHLIPAEALPRLEPAFVTDVDRTTVWVRPDPMTEIQVAFDRGEIRAGEAVQPVSEIALGLYAGQVARLFDLALTLQHRIHLRIASESKAEAGYGLLTGRVHAACPTEPLALSPATTAAEAFRHILRHCLRQLLCNQPSGLAALAGEIADPAGLVQMQVALDKLATALRLFDGLVQTPESHDLRTDLRQLERRLKPVRKWSILAGLIEQGFADQPEHRADLVESIAAWRHHAEAAASRALLGPEFTALQLRLALWLEDGRWHRDADPAVRDRFERPVAEPVCGWLERLYRKARKVGEHAGEEGAGGLRRLRRRIARLGQAAGFFRGLYQPAATRRFVAALDPLLAALELIDDDARALRMVGKLPGTPAAGHLSLWLTRRSGQRQAALPGLWRRFQDTPPFWKPAKPRPPVTLPASAGRS